MLVVVGVCIIAAISYGEFRITAYFVASRINTDPSNDRRDDEFTIVLTVKMMTIGNNSWGYTRTVEERFRTMMRCRNACVSVDVAVARAG